MKNNLIEFYDAISKRKINSDEKVLKYKSTLDEEICTLSNLRISTTNMEKLLHPIKTIRTRRTLKKLTNIKKDFNQLVESSLVEHISEESGDLTDDLTGALMYTKPKRVSSFIDRNPVPKVLKKTIK